ncbi:Ncapd2p [Chamberlinius hualienensis]
MEFKIPLNREDLLSRTFAGQYTVQEVLTVSEIERKYKECQTSLKEQGVSFITEYFDVFYSCLSRHGCLHFEIKSTLWRALIDAFEFLLSDIKLNLEDENLDSEMRLSLHNSLKMVIYLICNWLPSFEEEANNNNAALVGKKAKGRINNTLNSSDWDWNKEKTNFVELLDELCKMSFCRLWEQNEVEEEFSNLLINCCYKLLESPHLNRLREVKESIFHILAGLLKNQKHLVGHAVKIVQHLQFFDHSATSLAQAVVIFVKEYKMNELFNEIIREIANISARDSQEVSGSRAFVTFLTEVTKQIPSLILPNISYLASHLDGDSYNMRNCVLIIMGEILLQTNVDDKTALDEKAKMLRDQFMDHLEDHIHDVNAFVRSRCLQIWNQLCENHRLPISRQLRLLDLVIGRLQDKSCSVRKCAIHLITAILQSNPFAAKISLSKLEESFAKETEKLEHLLHESEPGSESNNTQENIPVSDDLENIQDSPDIAKQRLLLNYLKDSIAFAKSVSKALPVIGHLLSSSQTTDVLEAIQFFKTAYQFGIHNSIIGIQKMLTLVWSKEAEIKDAVSSTYKDLYLNPEQVGQGGRSEVASNLIRLTDKATIGEMTSLEQLIQDMVISGDIDKPVIGALFDRFRNQQKYTDFESHAAINLIGMAAGVHKEIIESGLDEIVAVGLGERAKKDCLFARDVCGALLKLGVDKPRISADFVPYYLPVDHVLFSRLSDILVSSISECENYSWVEMAQKAVDVIYKLSDQPDVICENILRAVFTSAISASSKHANEEVGTLPSKFLINIMLLSSHVALKQMLHLEITIFNHLKRRRQLAEEKSISSAIAKKNRRKSLNARDSLRESMIENCDSGMNTAVADDADAEYIRKVCDKEILIGDRMLANIAKMTLCVASNPGKYTNPNVQTAAVLALTKFMTVSEIFCEENIQLLFTILEKSNFPSTRAVIMVALGDLTCRFPNTFEPWTAHIFKRVLDDSFEVRQNALIILGHLLMNDMIKVKGCVSDVALCIIDDNDKIQKLAKQIFYDLSHKSNAIFNLLPDIISRLSDVEVGTTEEKFQTIMRFLLEFVKKDRLLESLVEKICLRFTVMKLDWQWRNLAFCLTSICESEKCLRKLLESVANFQEQLVEDAVYDAFYSILANAKKTFKQDLHTLIDDLEKQIEHHRLRVLGKEDADYVPKKPLTSTKRVRRKAKRKGQSRADSNSPDRKRSSPLEQVNESTRTMRKPRKKIVFNFSSDDEM